MSKKVTVIVEGKEYLVEVGDLGTRPIKATVNQRTYEVQVPQKSAAPAEPATQVASQKPVVSPKPKAAPSQAVSGDSVTAPMPGDIVEVNVKVGVKVNPGDVVCALEAMKMKNLIRSPQAGTIASVEVSVGESVDFGAVLVTFE